MILNIFKKFGSKIYNGRPIPLTYEFIGIPFQG